MNERIRNALLLICVVIVLLIVIDMIFNFSGVRVEKFQSEGAAYEAGSGGEGEDTREELNEEELDTTNIKSIVSKKDGRIFNIVFTNNDSDSNTCVIPSPVNPNMNITVNSDGTLGEQLSLSNSSNQKFQLKPIRNTNDLSNHLEGTTRGSDNRTVNTPFYVLVSKRDGFNNDRVLAYEPGRLYLATKANYDNQKWDVSNLRNPKKSVLTHAVTTNNMGSLNNANINPVNDEAFDPNKIKINFNLSDELKKQILNLDTENGGASSSPNTRVRDSSQFYGQQCSPQIPKDAISSLCPGCSPDRL